MSRVIHACPLREIPTGSPGELEGSKDLVHLQGHSGQSVQARALRGLLELPQNRQHDLLPLNHIWGSDGSWRGERRRKRC